MKAVMVLVCFGPYFKMAKNLFMYQRHEYIHKSDDSKSSSKYNVRLKNVISL